MDASVVETAKSRLNYDPATGVFTWKQDVGRRYGGKVAGKIDSEGYRRIGINGRHYFAHRLAWALVNGRPTASTIDHINRIRDDNRSANLREVNPSQNRTNAGMRSDNTSGVPGVHFIRRSGKWQVTISLGAFDTIEEAKAVRERAAMLLHGEFLPSVLHSAASAG